MGKKHIITEEEYEILEKLLPKLGISLEKVKIFLIIITKKIWKQ
jgi:hypothetical protein